MSYGPDWANVSNTPYRKYKRYTHEGGTLTPLIAHWPAGLKSPGLITHQPAHIMDIYATCLDLAGAEYPETFKGQATTPLASRSFFPQLQGQPADSTRPIFLELEGNQAVRLGDWKLVHSFEQPWELYNLSEDPSELNNLITQQPERATRLTALYAEWMQANGVQPWPLLK